MLCWLQWFIATLLHLVHSNPLAFGFLLMFVCAWLSLWNSINVSRSYLATNGGKCTTNSGNVLVSCCWYRVRGHVYPLGLKLFIQTSLWPFNHTSCRRAPLWSSQDSETVKSKSTGSTTHYRKRQKAWHIQSKSLWLPFDLPSLPWGKAAHMICSHLFIHLWEVRGRLIKSYAAGCSNSVLSFKSMTQILDRLQKVYL